VQKLINGHPEHIKAELGMHVHVFCNLVIALSKLSGLFRTKHVTLKEQLAIFLYAAVTGFLFSTSESGSSAQMKPYL
jgi:hypothetical protein